MKSVPIGEGDVLLRTEQLSRTVAGRTIVDAVSVVVHRGETVAIIGPSGAGKSSLLRMLNRLDEPSAGTVLLDGVDYHQIPPRDLRQRVGMVLQTPFLFPGTVADNLRFGPHQRGETLPDADIEGLLQRVALPGYAARDVSKLSGGEAQRVSLARTLANRPEIVLLDEPTSALDSAAKAGVEALLQSIMQDQGLTCLIVTHDEAQAARLADQVLVMEGGRAVAFGPTMEVLGDQPVHH